MNRKPFLERVREEGLWKLKIPPPKRIFSKDYTMLDELYRTMRTHLDAYICAIYEEAATRDGIKSKSINAGKVF